MKLKKRSHNIHRHERGYRIPTAGMCPGDIMTFSPVCECGDINNGISIDVTPIKGGWVIPLQAAWQMALVSTWETVWFYIAIKPVRAIRKMIRRSE